MKLVGTGNNVLDADLLSKLGVQQTSGSTVSQKEAKSTLRHIKSELRDEFTTSARGLARAEKAMANTLNLAIKSGWVRGSKATDILKDFIKGSGDDSLSKVVENLRDEIKDYQASNRGGYGSYSRGTSSYGSRSSGRSTSSYGSRSSSSVGS